MSGNAGLIDLKRGETKVAASTFIGILWAGTGLALCFLVFRIFVRVRVFRKLFADDFLVIGAWLIMLTNAIIWQTQYKIVYQLYAFFAAGAFPDVAFLTRFEVFLKFQSAILILLYTCLWAVKLSFLIFFRRLELKVSGFRVWWWIVLGITIASWVSCVGDNQYDCETGDIERLFVTCSQPDAINYEWATLRYNCAIDVVTDVMIMTIPVLLLWNIKIDISQKLALLGLFSLTIITIIFSIIRVAVVTVPNAQANIIWLAFWGNIEMLISVIVACLGSFRQLFVKQNPSVPMHHYVGSLNLPTEPDNISFWRRGIFSRNRKLDSSNNPNSLNGTENKTKSLKGNGNFKSTSLERIISIPLHSIQITNEYDVESAPASSEGLSKPSPARMNSSRIIHRNEGKGNGSYQQIDEP